VIKAKKIQDFKFLQGYWYFNTLEGTKEKILESIQPKLMSKFEVISKNLQKTAWNELKKKCPFWVIKAKNPKFRIFTGLRVLKHTSRH